MEPESALTSDAVSAFKSWLCVVCGFVYHEADGIPDEGIPAGTRWEDVPTSWVCTECGVGKQDFEMTEV
ncbi:rubredoxin [Pantoea sp. Ap-967]|nr:rubredoxin [Pantoea sp. Ap-967]NIE77164.1 rubredoxin [Pantoea sp. Ap-967]